MCSLRAVLDLGASQFVSQCTVPEFLPWGVVAFWPISGKIPKLQFKFWTFLHANAMFFTFLPHWHYNAHQMDAHVGQLEPKCLFKVQYLNNRLFPFSIKFLSIMRGSFRKCTVRS